MMARRWRTRGRLDRHGPDLVRRRGQRLLVTAVALVALLAAVDLARPGWLEPVRAASTWALGPLERALHLGGDDRLAEVTRERDDLARRLAAAERSSQESTRLQELLGADSVAGRTVLPGRVIARERLGSPTAERRLSLDIGARDGVVLDSTVVAGNGLVGRVTRVDERSCDVAVLGADGVVVGVRVGPEGLLGSVSGAHPAGLPDRPVGTLTLSLLDATDITPGQKVVTLGSSQGGPYAPGIDVGEVVSVDPPRGQMGRSAVVRPAVEIDRLQLVAVVVPRPSELPRPAVTAPAASTPSVPASPTTTVRR